MRRAVVLLLSLICALSVAAQGTGNAIDKALKENDIITLQRLHPTLPNSLSATTRLRVEAELNIALNNLEGAKKSISNLLNNHSAELGEELTSHYFSLLLEACYNLGDYRSAAHLVSGIEGAKAEHRLFSTIAKVRPMRVKIPKGGAEVPFKLRKVGNGGHHIWVDVEIREGKKRIRKEFVFDSGAGLSCVSEEFARANNFRFLNDSIATGGVGGRLNLQLATTPRLQIGKMVVENPIFLVFRRGQAALDKASGREFANIIGNPIMCEAGCVEIDFRGNNIRFGSTAELSSKSPLFRRGSLYYIGLEVDGLTIDAEIDTGAVSTMMTPLFHTHYKGTNPTAEIRKLEGRGVGGTNRFEGIIAPLLSFRLGNRTVQLEQVKIATNNDDYQVVSPYSQGWLGMDLLAKFSRIVLDFDTMSFSAE